MREALIYNEIRQKSAATVLDIGFGTGILTNKLYENGHSIDGIDFSAEMIRIAQAKMPHARLIQADISQGFPTKLTTKKYDFIVSTYALHHLTDADKPTFIKQLLDHLNVDGKLLIGDIAFKTQADLDHCRKESGPLWDQDEFYFVHENLAAALSDIAMIDYQQVSHCGGIFDLSKK